MTRRHFSGRRHGGARRGCCLRELLARADLFAQSAGSRARPGGLPGLPHFAPKAKRVIYLFQSGAPSQLDLFDYKPQLAKMQGTDLPDSIRKASG